MSSLNKKVIEDAEVYRLYEQVTSKVEDIKQMLEKKKEITLAALNDYTSNIVDQLRMQLVPEMPLESEDHHLVEEEAKVHTFTQSQPESETDVSGDAPLDKSVVSNKSTSDKSLLAEPIAQLLSSLNCID